MVLGTIFAQIAKSEKLLCMISQTKTISVALCTYNGARYLREQLESIRKQTRLPDELVVCDDGSQDETVDILREFAAGSGIKTRIHLNTVNLGFTYNFEQALGLCRGDLVFMADQDDIWFPGKVEEVSRLFLDFPKIIGATHDGRLVDEHGKWFGTSKLQQIVRGYGKDNGTVTGALSCIRRSGLDIILPFPSGVNGHDTWITYVFSWFPDRWLFSYICLQDIRRHSSNTSQWVGNSFKPIGKLDVIWEQIQTQNATSYNDRLAMNIHLTAKLQDCAVEFSVFESDKVSDCHSRLLRERNAIQRRQAIVDHPRKLIRWILALRLLSAGGYGYFNGLRSFVRDLTR